MTTITSINGNKDEQELAMDQIRKGFTRLCGHHNLNEDQSFEAAMIDTTDALTSSMNEVMSPDKQFLFCEHMIKMLFDEHIRHERKAGLIVQLIEINASRNSG